MATKRVNFAKSFLNFSETMKNRASYQLSSKLFNIFKKYNIFFSIIFFLSGVFGLHFFNILSWSDTYTIIYSIFKEELNFIVLLFNLVAEFVAVNICAVILVLYTSFMLFSLREAIYYFYFIKGKGDATPKTRLLKTEHNYNTKQSFKYINEYLLIFKYLFLSLQHLQSNLYFKTPTTIFKKTLFKNKLNMYQIYNRNLSSFYYMTINSIALNITKNLFNFNYFNFKKDYSLFLKLLSSKTNLTKINFKNNFNINFFLNLSANLTKNKYIFNNFFLIKNLKPIKTHWLSYKLNTLKYQNTNKNIYTLIFQLTNLSQTKINSFFNKRK